MFARKTQGHPFHVLMVALGLLAECRFPGAAAVGGDIDARDGEQARALLQQLLGQRFAVPLCTNEPRLRSTLQPCLSPVAIDRAVQHLVRPPDPAIIGDILGHLRTAPLGKVRHELETFVPSATSFDALCNETQEVFVTLTGSLSRAFDDPMSEELLAALDQVGCSKRPPRANGPPGCGAVRRAGCGRCPGSTCGGARPRANGATSSYPKVSHR